MNFPFEIKPIPNSVWKEIEEDDTRIEGYTGMVYRLFKDTGGPSANLHSQFGIITEAGELADAFKQAHYKNLPLDIENIIEELGDILFYYIAYKNNGRCRISDEYLLDFIKMSAISPLRVKNKLEADILDKISKFHQVSILTSYSFIYNLTAIANIYGYGLEHIILYNKYKLAGSEGRYQSGKFSVNQALARKDKQRE